jgi:REP element-mobilizing transposase RayT
VEPIKLAEHSPDRFHPLKNQHGQRGDYGQKNSKRRAEKRKRIPPFSEAGHTPLMPDYRRNRVPGGTFFFTVNLLDRRSNLLVARIDALRDAVRQVRARAPFHIDAWVVLPDHMHCLWTLPEGDANFPGRWRAIKTAFAKSLPVGEPRSPVMTNRGERGIGQRRYWEHTIRDELRAPPEDRAPVFAQTTRRAGVPGPTQPG